MEIFACEHIEIGLNFLVTATQYSTVLIGTFSFQLLFPKGPLFVSIKIWNNRENYKTSVHVSSEINTCQYFLYAYQKPIHFLTEGYLTNVCFFLAIMGHFLSHLVSDHRTPAPTLYFKGPELAPSLPSFLMANLGLCKEAQVVVSTQCEGIFILFSLSPGDCVIFPGRSFWKPLWIWFHCNPTC